ncbi:MAG: riboflavin synthase [Pirellula sp.]|jgi:riboflavin synthase
MFTGLVEGMGFIRKLASEGTGLRMTVDLGSLVDGVAIGDSIANSGCCLTVVSMNGSECDFELGSETLSKTLFRNLKIGDPINIERSLRVGDRLGGHFVSGHVDGLGTLADRLEEGVWSHFKISAPPHLLIQLVPKGSITIDGVSLTVVNVEDSSFTIALIPHTLQVTTLGRLKAGDQVHLETDILAKYAQRAVLYPGSLNFGNPS